MRRIVQVALLAAVFMFGSVALLSATEEGRVGLVVNQPLNGTMQVGVQFHVTPEISIRPLGSLFYDRVTEEAGGQDDDGEDADVTRTSLILNVAPQLNFHFVHTEKVSGYGYARPSFAFGRVSEDIDGGDDDSETDIRFDLGAGLGAQHMFTESFGLFAEAGLNLQFGDLDFDDDESFFRASTGTSNLGVILYLN